jgi:hypothetical protein
VTSARRARDAAGAAADHVPSSRRKPGPAHHLQREEQGGTIMKTTHTPRKLSLHRSTIRTLASDQLAQAVGGVATLVMSCRFSLCHTCICPQ